eukprot:CAMPEP_0167765212 /NCGR_PEP_ID=MMETSP0110_2-20121227/14544_1 /TAXON_ID=629695 /ORGANISM="Gymnochlora sp., Strain CCMP2014" /LENGTH=83 /DNA_ID=CAMNT_0007652865 /DNA_START=197 /DNA_END=448 /DNA_ORIENTATION=+
MRHHIQILARRIHHIVLHIPSSPAHSDALGTLVLDTLPEHTPERGTPERDIHERGTLGEGNPDVGTDAGIQCLIQAHYICVHG